MGVKKIIFKFEDINEKDFNGLLWHFYYDIIGDDLKNENIKSELYSHHGGVNNKMKLITESYFDDQEFTEFGRDDNNTKKFGK